MNNNFAISFYPCFYLCSYWNIFSHQFFSYSKAGYEILLFCYCIWINLNFKPYFSIFLFTIWKLNFQNFVLINLVYVWFNKQLTLHLSIWKVIFVKNVIFWNVWFGSCWWQILFYRIDAKIIQRTIVFLLTNG